VCGTAQYQYQYTLQSHIASDLPLVSFACCHAELRTVRHHLDHVTERVRRQTPQRTYSMSTTRGTCLLYSTSRLRLIYCRYENATTPLSFRTRQAGALEMLCQNTTIIIRLLLHDSSSSSTTTSDSRKCWPLLCLSFSHAVCVTCALAAGFLHFPVVVASNALHCTASV